MTGRTVTKSRPATREDIERFFGQMPGRSIRARVLEIDGEIAGVAGYYIVNGVAVMFSDSRGDIPAMTVWRESKAMMDSMKIPAVCVAEENSGPFLKRLGWTYEGPSKDGDVYSWQH